MVNPLVERVNFYITRTLMLLLKTYNFSLENKIYATP